MLDNRIYTFLELCKVMNYRKTAEKLNMTQPAVTQHIKYLENQYGCKLFEYGGKVLTKTEKCLELEQHARAMVYANEMMQKEISSNPVQKISIGATKTIGEYTIEDLTMKLIQKEEIELQLIIDNTQMLLRKLDNLELDILLLEGYFDKNSYGHQLIKKEEIVGICARNHPFAGRTICLEEIFREHLIVRESGSGTRSIFEQLLYGKNYSMESFMKKTTISNYRLIEKAVEKNLGISFVYRAVATQDKFAIFRLEGIEMMHEFNYVFLKNTSAEKVFNIIRN